MWGVGCGGEWWAKKWKETEGEGKAIRDICEMRIGKKVANNRRGDGGSSGCNVGGGGDMLMVVGAHQSTCQTVRLLSDWSHWTAATVAQSDRVDTGPAAVLSRVELTHVRALESSHSGCMHSLHLYL